MPYINAQRQEDELYSCVNHSTCMVASLVIHIAIVRWVFYLLSYLFICDYNRDEYQVKSYMNTYRWAAELQCIIQ